MTAKNTAGRVLVLPSTGSSPWDRRVLSLHAAVSGKFAAQLAGMFAE
jgi:hypothetical protein